jgi:thiamine-phosphate pyrophosphorylase
VAVRISSGSLWSTVVAPRIPWMRTGGVMAPNVAALIRLMLVTDDKLLRGRDLVQLARAAERGGITALQVRLKSTPARELAEIVRTLVATLNIPVLVNDRPDVALAAGAAGTHLGPDDMAVRLVRRIAPPGFIIGASVGSEAEAETANEADYWGVGPWGGTTTKGDAGQALGPDGFARIVGLAGDKGCIAIGAVRPEDVPLVGSHGGRGIAVVSGILDAEDIQAAARRYAVAVSASIP